MPDIDPILISVKEAAKALGLTINTVYKLCKAGEIEVVYYGTRSMKVVVASLHEYVKNLPNERPSQDVA